MQLPLLIRPCRVFASSLFFFFSGSAAHRDLHSFPTRRSSDLVHSLTVSPDGTRVAVGSHAPPAGEFTMSRSEEHTSELQSRQYLVCRLLLEKKKPQK